MTTPESITPARRAKLLQAHRLRRQGLTHRQIAEQMRCAHSTVGRYLKEFQQYRTQIIESLADDQLVDILEQLDQTDDSGYERRLHAARELRLLLDSLDRIIDRRQRRQRRIQEHDIADQVRLVDALGELTQKLADAGPPPLDLNQLDPGELASLNTLHQLSGRPLAHPNGAGHDSPEPAEPDPPAVGPSSTTAEPEPSTVEPAQATIDQNRPESTTIDQEPEQSPVQSGKWPKDPKKVRAYLASISPSSAPPPRPSITGDAYAALRELERTSPRPWKPDR